MEKTNFLKSFEELIQIPNESTPSSFSTDQKLSFGGMRKTLKLFIVSSNRSMAWEVGILNNMN